MSDRSQTQSGEPSGGEDDSSTEREGDDSHLHEDQKSPASKAMETEDGDGGDDASKTQDLAKAGRPGFDPNAGEE